MSSDTHTGGLAPQEIRERLEAARELLLANAVMFGEIPAPTFDEGRRARFMLDRFTESGCHNVSTDEVGNAAAIYPGKTGSANILVSAHLDTVFPASADHTVHVHTGHMTGAGIMDNSLGCAAVASLPFLLEAAGIELEDNLILLGTTRSHGQGNIEGMRFFLENNKHPLRAGLLCEGGTLGRLSYESLGMLRGVIEVGLPPVESAAAKPAESVTATTATVAPATAASSDTICATAESPDTASVIAAVTAESTTVAPDYNHTGANAVPVHHESAQRGGEFTEGDASQSGTSHGQGKSGESVAAQATRSPLASASEHHVVAGGRSETGWAPADAAGHDRGAIPVMHRVLSAILALDIPQTPPTQIILGSVEAGTSFNTRARNACLRFEVRSEGEGIVGGIAERIHALVDTVAAQTGCPITFRVVARRRRQRVARTHPYVQAGRRVLESLGVPVHEAPSTGEIGALLEHHIPALTIGLTYGRNRHQHDENIEIEPLFTGLTQVLALLHAIDGGLEK